MGDQISRAIHLDNDKEEKDDLAKLFLQVGLKAAKASSFAAAAAYLKCGTDLLNSKRWKEQYKLSLTLYNAAAEIEYYCGNFPRVDALIGKVLRGAQSFDDTLIARFTRIYSLGSRCEMSQGFNEGIEVLKQLGEPLPRNVGRGRAHYEIAICKLMLRRTSEESILEMPVLDNKDKSTTMRMMIIIHPFAFNRGDAIGPIIAARAVQMSLRYGINELSCAVFAMIALVFAIRGDLDESYCCSRFALCLLSKYQSTEWQARVAVTVYAFAFPIKHPVKASIEPLFEGHRAGLVFGDIHFSMICAFHLCLIRLLAGDPLALVLDTAKTYRKLCPQYGQHFVTPAFDILIQLALNLMGKASDPMVLSGEAMQEGDAFENWQGKNPMAFLYFLNFKHFMAVYMNDYDLVDELAGRMENAKGGMPPVALITHSFLHALGSSKVPQQRLHLTKLKEFARQCPANFLHKVYLVEAELANTMGCFDEAIKKYEMSIV